MIELGGGWNGRIFNTQLYFNVLDGGMIVLAVFTWNFVHPGVFLAEPSVSHSEKELELLASGEMSARMAVLADDTRPE